MKPLAFVAGLRITDRDGGATEGVPYIRKNKSA